MVWFGVVKPPRRCHPLHRRGAPPRGRTDSTGSENRTRTDLGPGFDSPRLHGQGAAQARLMDHRSFVLTAGGPGRWRLPVPNACHGRPGRRREWLVSRFNSWPPPSTMRSPGWVTEPSRRCTAARRIARFDSSRALVSRKASEAKARRTSAQLDAELRAELDGLLELTSKCYTDECPCHEREWQLIRTLKFMLTGRSADGNEP